MNYIKRIYLKSFMLLIIILLNNNIVFSQDYYSNLKKYWFYRDRLKYFVVNDNPSITGTNLVAGIRNKYNNDKVDFGQPMIYFGYYVGMLATEWYLLSKNNQNASSTLTELENALNSYVRLDLCEDKEPWNLSTAEYDGFFMREDVPYNFATIYSNELNINLDNTAVFNSSGEVGYVNGVISYNDDFVNGTVDLESNIMSQDEVIGLLMGLALVKKFLPSGSWAQWKAQQIANKTVTYVRNVNISTEDLPWIIFDPNGNPVPKGGNAGGYAYGFAKAAQVITNLPLSTFYGIPEAHMNGEASWDLLQFTVFGKSSHAHMVATLAAIGNSWIHLGVNTTGNGIWATTNQEDWHPFYLLLWKILHDKNNDNFLDEAYTQQNNAPCSGPYYYSNSIKTSYGGWASSGKYWHTVDEQDNGDNDFPGLYNGLDYMLLYNMYHIAMTDLEETPDGFPSYINYMESYLTLNMPYTINLPLNIIIGAEELHPYGLVQEAEFNAFNKITSSQQIKMSDQYGRTKDLMNYPIKGHVTYRAGSEIDLKPGFTVENGAYFDASIGEFNCNFNKSSNTTPVCFSDFVINSYDSLISRYEYTPLAENYSSNEDMLKDYKIEPPKQDTVTFNNYDIFSIAAYPNPFNNTTTIEYNIPYSSDVNISIFDIYGAKIMQPVNNYLEKGEYSNVVNMSNISKGIYYCKLSSGTQSKTIKLVLSD
ncbi:MAG: hypothetical protein A2033_06470 [Bacteroidetes bacterium GWA2_31_9]|nr:MAG: hypothetical protein A2033_06470 [Bacteroidetes bacterium GWA2_31_9]